MNDGQCTMNYTATLTTANGVIPAKAGIQETIPPYQVRGRLNQARNNKLFKTYIVKYNKTFVHTSFFL
jgi:hypothetical protein